MIKDLQNNLIGIAIGIRFRANFSIEDQLGRIVDQILYSKNSYFNTDVFPLVNGQVGKRVLINNSTGDTMRIDNSNIILEIQFGNKFKVEDKDKIAQNFYDQIINGVMKDFKIREIVRVGFIKRYLFPIKELAKTFVDKTIGNTLTGVNDINLQFSKRLPAREALIKQKVNDYNNAIFNVIKKSNLDEIFMSLDYQSYFDPFLPSVNELKFKPFLEDVEAFTNNNYIPWLKSNYLEEK